MQIALLMHNIRSTYNVGSLLRTADGFGVTRIYYSGYTPVYNDQKLLLHLRAKLNRQIAKTALGAENLASQQTAEDIEQLLRDLKAQNWTIVGLENHLSGQKVYPLSQIQTKLAPDAKVALLLGEEVRGIPPELYSLVDFFVEIPMFGQKESFNVSVAAAIALYELRRETLD